MPDTIRREVLAYGERTHPVARVTLVGPESMVSWGYWPRPNAIHLVGSPGPRGGARTVCGKAVAPRWDYRDLSLPAHRHRTMWTQTCENCKRIVGLP